MPYTHEAQELTRRERKTAPPTLPRPGDRTQGLRRLESGLANHGAVYVRPPSTYPNNVTFVVGRALKMSQIYMCIYSQIDMCIHSHTHLSPQPRETSVPAANASAGNNFQALTKSTEPSGIACMVSVTKSGRRREFGRESARAPAAISVG